MHVLKNCTFRHFSPTKNLSFCRYSYHSPWESRWNSTEVSPLLLVTLRQCSGAESRSGSFYHQAKIVRNTLVPTVLWFLLDFLSLKNDVNVPLKSKKQKNLIKFFVFLASWISMTKIAGSGSTSGSEYGSGSFYHQAKIVRNTLVPTVLWFLLDFLSLKNDVNVPLKSKKQKNVIKFFVFLASWISMTKIAGSGSTSGSEYGSGSISQRHGSADPDPHQNVIDP